MRHTQDKFQTLTEIQKLIKNFFVIVPLETVSKEIPELFALSCNQHDLADCEPETWAEQFKVLSSVIMFLSVLEKSATNDTDILLNSSKIDRLIDLHNLIRIFYSTNSARKVSFELWDNYVSGICNDSVSGWEPNKVSNLAFSTLRLSELLHNLEAYRVPEICLS